MDFTRGMKTYYDSIELSPAQVKLVRHKLQGLKFTAKEMKVINERCTLKWTEEQNKVYVKM